MSIITANIKLSSIDLKIETKYRSIALYNLNIDG